MIHALRPPTNHPSPRGFSLLELLIVIGVMLALMSVSVLVMGNVLQSTRTKSTQATISKIYQLISIRQDALVRMLDPDSPTKSQREAAYAKADQFVKQAYQLDPTTSPIDLRHNQVKYDRIAKVKDPITLAFKYREVFPQRFVDLCGADRVPGQVGDDDGSGPIEFEANGFPDIAEFVDGNDLTEAVNMTRLLIALRQQGRLNVASHLPKTESSELLYLALMEAPLEGNLAFVPPEFSATEVQDTDGDGLMEFIDAWGEPLRFYRSPTRLIRCGVNDDGTAASAPNNAGIYAVPDPRYALTVFPNLPSQVREVTSGGESSPLQRDPYDPTALIIDYVIPDEILARRFEAWFYTPRTYHTMVVISSGPDRELGMYEPHDSPFPPSPTDHQGHLGQPTQYGALEDSPLADNVGGLK